MLLEYDKTEEEWVLRLQDEADTEIRDKDKSVIENAMEWLEKKGMAE